MRQSRWSFIAGDNDLASSDTVTAIMVFQRFKQLFTDIRSRLPKASVFYVSIKPSPSRWRLKEKMIQTNAFHQKLFGQEKEHGFCQRVDADAQREGGPMDDLFKEDKLHMKPEGYAIWAKVIEPLLK